MGSAGWLGAGEGAQQGRANAVGEDGREAAGEWKGSSEGQSQGEVSYEHL